jgi:hypothetical protein
MLSRIAAVTILIAALAACGRTPPPSELADLALATPALLRDFPQMGVVPESKWPPAVARLDPERVYVAPDGLYITTSSFFVQEWGLFVPRAPGFTAHPGTDPSYTSVGQGVFSYYIAG